MTADRSTTSVVVVGAGVAGLSAAWTLQRAGHRVTVLESGSRAGGKLWADEFGGHQVDRGADAFLARVPDAVDLCHELGLDDELVSPAERTAFVLRGGRLRRFPDGLVLGVPTDFEALEASGVVSDSAVARARRDLEDPSPPLADDTTVGRYVRDRMGDEVFETLVSPLLSGINAGDADQLSLDAGAPQLAAAARAGGSLVAHLRRQRLRNAADPEAPVFHSLAGGAGRLAAVLADRLESQIDYRSTVVAIEPAGGRYAISLDDGTDRSGDGVIVATPGWVSGSLLGAGAPRTATDLAALEYASVAVVTFSFALDRIDHALEGSGFLVPEIEGLLMTACSWASSKWPHWADPGTAVVRASVGRAHDPRAGALDDDALVAHLVGELGPTLGVTGPPTAVQVSRWPRALPQYRPGHLDRVDAWDLELAEHLPRVALAGAATRGLGVPACIASGRTAARTVARQLG